MLKNKTSLSLIAGGTALVGLVAGIATMAGAQSITNNVTTTGTSTVVAAQTQTIDTPEPGDVADASDATTSASAQVRHHSPLGGDGIVSSINGTTIVMSEEADEGGASYTIDASKASITNNGATATLADIKVGQKIFVQGTTNGMSVSATNVSVGHPGDHGAK